MDLHLVADLVTNVVTLATSWMTIQRVELPGVVREVRMHARTHTHTYTIHGKELLVVETY